MALTRRRLLGTAVAGGAGLTAAAATGSLFAPAAADPRRAEHALVPGPLRADPAGLLALPAGFSYRLVSVAGETSLVTGEKSPDRPDGTGRSGGGTASGWCRTTSRGPARRCPCR